MVTNPISTSQPDLLGAFEQLDNMRRAVDMGHPFEPAHGTAENTLRVHDLLIEKLRQQHIVPIAELGQPSDPHLHQQILAVSSPSPRGTILKVEAQGYRDALSGILLRPAKVVVSAGGAPDGSAVVH